MTTSPYDTLPTGKQALPSESGETIKQDAQMPEFPAAADPAASAKAPNPITDPYGGYQEISLEEAAAKAAADQSREGLETGDPDEPVSGAADPGSGSEESAAKASGWEDPGNSGDSGSFNSPGVSEDSGIPDDPENSSSPGERTPLDARCQYDTVRLRNRCHTREYILPFEETLLVPDTMPDMGQILFSEGRAVSSQPGKTCYTADDTFSGEILLFTVYRPDGATEAPVDVVRSTVTFQTNSCWNTPGTQKEADISYNATVRLKETETIRLNERKFQVRGTLCITITEIRKAELHVLRDTADPDLILRQDTVKAADLVFETEEFADIEQEIAVEDGQPKPVRILKESFCIAETHRQITSGKLIISGMLQTQILYLGEDDDDEGRICSRSEKTEFTHFILLQSPLDSNLIKVDFGDDGLKLAIENQDSFRLEGQIRIQVHGYENRQIPIVSDAYHKEKSIGFERKKVELSCLENVLSGEISAREVVSLSEQEQHPDRLLGGSILPGDISTRREHGRVIIEGTIPVRILALDENERAFLIEAEVPLRGALDSSASADSLQSADLFECSAIKDFWIDAINSRQIEINLSASIQVWISGTCDFSTLEEFTASTEAPQQPTMAICVTTANDSLWDIARYYQCDTDTLASLNQIDPDAPLKEGTKLLIVR